jgi:hypothetical protein
MGGLRMPWCRTGRQDTVRRLTRRSPLRDKKWWGGMADPPRQIGNALLSAIPNTRDLV